MIFNAKPEEQAAIEDIANQLELSHEAVMRQALRLFQLYVKGVAKVEFVTNSLKQCPTCKGSMITKVMGVLVDCPDCGLVEQGAEE